MMDFIKIVSTFPCIKGFFLKGILFVCLAGFISSDFFPNVKTEATELTFSKIELYEKDEREASQPEKVDRSHVDFLFLDKNFPYSYDLICEATFYLHRLFSSLSKSPPLLPPEFIKIISLNPFLSR